MESTPMTRDIQLGQLVQDKISGLSGIVTARAEHLTGCSRIEVSPSDVGGNERGDCEFFYEAQLKVLNGHGIEVEEDPVTETDFQLGQRVEDDVTGFEGVVTTITYQLYNCPLLGVQAIDETDNTEKGTKEWFDVPRASSVDSGVSEDFTDLASSESTATTGSTGKDISRASVRE